MLALGVSFAAVRLRALTATGALAAFIVGTLIAGTSWIVAIALVLFFTSSSALSRHPGREHTGQRTAVQVLANGGPATFCCLLASFTDHRLALVAAVGSIAAANADTWATEIGRNSGACPRLITTGRRVPRGTSGAISGRGTIALILGAASIAVVGVRLAPPPIAASLAILTGGVAGAVLDSLLGATVQERRFCEACHRVTERMMHTCGGQTRHLRGWRWMTNDTVNAACTLTGAVTAAALGSIV